MIEIILVRHGEADYSEAHEKGYVFFNNLAPLTTAGVEQAHEVSKNKLLANAGIIISSPYTRALQTAAIISRHLDLDLRVDMGFHERLPDMQNMLRTKEELDESYEEYDLHKGIHVAGKNHHFESVEQQINRVKRSLDKYINYKKIIIVSHGELIRRFALVRLPFCGIAEVKYGKDFEFLAWS